MEKKYFYNPRTHTLHVMGFCSISKAIPFDAIFFEDYNDALAHEGLAVGMCKNCQKKMEMQISKKER